MEPKLYTRKAKLVEATFWSGDQDSTHDQVEPFDAHPLITKYQSCKKCGRKMGKHGWIKDSDSSQLVCPGNYVIVAQGEPTYSVPSHILVADYELNEEQQ